MSFILQRVRGDVEGAGEFTRTALMQHVGGDSLLVGRGASAQLRFEEAAVALEHARLERRPGGLEIVDCGSLTGTYVNGRRVERAELRDHDWVEIGRHRLTVHFESPATPVVVYVQELVEERAAPQAAAPRAPEIDHVAAYGLRRRWLGPGPFTAYALTVGAAALLWLAWTGGEHFFRPGPVSDAHAALAADCAACHVPWRGADDRRCAACHAGPEHQPRQVAAPACPACHLEHRFQPRLARVADAKCLACHRELRVAGGGRPAFAARVTDFAADHPEFALTVEEQGRVPIDRARRSDPTALAFGHALHLRPDLKSPDGPVQLDCFACHSPSATGQRVGEIAPVEYERHCQSCHRLVFDPRLPDAPHERPEVVHATLLRAYAEPRPGGPAQRPSLPEQRRLLPRRALDAAPPPLLNVSERVLRQAVEAEVNLYRAACDKCHEVDLGGVLPAVDPPRVPARWFVYAAFPHQRHRRVECTVCHAGAAASRDTADLLLPSIAACRACHGPQPRAAGPAAGATTRCVSCHLYHDKSRTGEWGRGTPSGVWETGSGFEGGLRPAAQLP
jgi:hypothetical protein